MRKLTHRLHQRVTDQTYERVLNFAHAHGLMKAGHIIDGGIDQLLNHLFDQYEQTKLSSEQIKLSSEQLFPFMGLNLEETEYVFDVLEKTDANFAVELRTGFLARIKSLDKFNDRLSMIDLENPEERQRRRGAGEKALEHVVAQLMAENDAAINDKDKVYLSSGLLKAVAHVGKTTAVEFQRNNRALFDTHHSQHGWHDVKTGQRHNQLVSLKYKRLMGDEEFTNEQA